MNRYYTKQNLIQFVRKNPLQVIFVSLLSMFVCLALTYGLILPYRATGQVLKAATSDPLAGAGPHEGAASYADIVERVSPSVVTIRSEMKSKPDGQQGQLAPFMNDPRFKEFFGGQQAKPRIERSVGSGVVVGPDGTILTNNHVVDGAQKIQVEFPDRKTFTAKIVGTDPLSDLAVLKIDAQDLPILALGDSDRVRVGDVVLAIGNPLGLRQTVTSGIISAKGRQTGLSDGSFEDFLQTDAPINQGNSGGALINLNGELVGINSQILSPSGGNIGIGFAIPSNMAKSVMEQLLKNGKVQRGMLGVGIQNLDSDLAASFGLKDVNAALVNSVKPDSPADRAGIEQGDVITAIGGVRVSDSNELRNRIANTAPGTDVSLTILRDGSEKTFNVKLTEFALEKRSDAEDAGAGEPDSPADSSVGGHLGITVQPLTEEIARRLGLKNAPDGLVVTDVQDSSPAEEAGLQPGDVILEINRQTVLSPDDIRAALAKSADKPALFLIDRQNQTIYVTVHTG